MVPLAYKEGVITGMEFLWSHGAVIQAGEFRHGPLEIVESGVPFLFLVPTDSSRVYMEQKKSGTIIKGAKVGRNDPCPCGSGKKYKFCCGR